MPKPIPATDIEKRACDLFASGYYCAESVLLAIAEEHGIESDLIPALATGFCSGMARRCGPCGALTGGIMAIGLILGRRTAQDSVEPAYQAVQALLHAFEAEFGSRGCHEILGCDLGTEAGQETFSRENLIERCTRIVGRTAGLTAQVLKKPYATP
jgi:C_GCAxxG_C_C family probable redox protein